MLRRQRNRFPAALVLAGALLLPIAPAAAAGAPPRAEAYTWEALWTRLLAWAGLGDQDPTPTWAAEDVGPMIDPDGLQAGGSAGDAGDEGPMIDPDGLR